MSSFARRLRVPSIAVLAALLVATLGAEDAGAARFHTRLLKSAPAKDAILTTPPTALELTFSEKVELPTTRIALLDAAQQPVALAPVTRAPDVKESPVVARITGTLVPGVYAVHWTVAGADGHAVKGSYSFTLR
jgi:methionine-rich copper-binding protein CopC